MLVNLVNLIMRTKSVRRNNGFSYRQLAPGCCLQNGSMILFSALSAIVMNNPIETCAQINSKFIHGNNKQVYQHRVENKIQWGKISSETRH